MDDVCWCQKVGFRNQKDRQQDRGTRSEEQSDSVYKERRQRLVNPALERQTWPHRIGEIP